MRAGSRPVLAQIWVRVRSSVSIIVANNVQRPVLCIIVRNRSYCIRNVASSDLQACPDREFWETNRIVPLAVWRMYMYRVKGHACTIAETGPNPG